MALRIGRSRVALLKATYKNLGTVHGVLWKPLGVWRAKLVLRFCDVCNPCVDQRIVELNKCGWFVVAAESSEDRHHGVE